MATDNGTAPKVVGQVMITLYDNGHIQFHAQGMPGPMTAVKVLRGAADAAEAQAIAAENQKGKLDLPPPGLSTKNLRG